MSLSLSRTAFFGRCLGLCLYPVLTVAAGNAVLIGLPQARETLFAFSDFGDFGLFLLSMLYWSAVAWYCSRIMLGRRFPVDDLPPCVDRRFARWLNLWLPRLLGVLSTLPITGFLWWAGGDATVWLPALLTTAAYLAFVVLRRRFSRSARRGVRARQYDPFPRFDKLEWTSWLFIALVFVVSFGVLVAVWVAPVAAPRWLGAPVLLLVALGSWTAFGSMILTYLPRTWGWPSLAVAPLLVAFGVSFLRENHVVAEQGSAVAPPPRPDLVRDFVAWNEARGAHRTDPVYLVAAAGGASRAAYWTGLVLKQLEEAARANGVPFASNVYAMSGVSGGSLGVASFVGSLAAERARYGQHLPARMQPDPTVFLGRDFLAPIVAGMLYPDAVATFLPFPCHACDRSHWIEGAWMSDWRAVGSGAPQFFAQPFLAVAGQPGLPRLLLNATSVSDGRRVVQTPMVFVPREAHDLFGPTVASTGLTVAGAVHNSARFTYVSPAGHVLNKAGGPWDDLVDGGYFENSGTATLQALINQLIQHKAETGMDESKFVVILIENEPVTDVQWICRGESAPIPPEPVYEATAWPEIAVPPKTLYKTRTARAQLAESDLVRQLGDCKAWQVFELRYPKLSAVKREPPMSWYLNTATRKAMEDVLKRQDTDPALKFLQHNWEGLLTRLGVHQ